jgi:site-specific recombinase XerD
MKTEINNFLNSLDRSPKTIFAYRNALEQFVKVVSKDAELNTETYVKFLTSLKNKSPSTQRVYRTAVRKFCTFCKAGNWTELQEATQHHTRKSRMRMVKFNREAAEKVVAHCASLRRDLQSSRILENRLFLSRFLPVMIFEPVKGYASLPLAACGKPLKTG